MKRPPSIWITQILIGILVLIFCSNVLRNLRLNLTQSTPRQLLGRMILLSLISFLLFAFWGLVKKRQWGKWLGICSLLLIWAMMTYGQLFPHNQRYEYNNDAQRVGAASGMIMMQMGMLTLMLRLAFSKKVNRFFQNQSDEVNS